MSFCVLYKKKKKVATRLILKEYHKLFQRTRFTIRRPGIDRCNLCDEYRVKLRRRYYDPCRVTFDLHKRKVRKYREIKATLLKDIPNNTHFIEFDYPKNLPLQKLSCNEQFYKILMWLYTFNVHCHNNSDSTMYSFCEYKGEKGSNSIVSFVHHFITRKGMKIQGGFLK